MKNASVVSINSAYAGFIDFIKMVQVQNASGKMEKNPYRMHCWIDRGTGLNL